VHLLVCELRVQHYVFVKLKDLLKHASQLLVIDTYKMRVSYKILIMNKENVGVGVNTSRYSVCITRS